MVEHIPVFFEGQDDLIDILATSMCSICYNTKSFIDFYILDCGIHEFNKKQLESLKEKFNNFSIKYIPIDLKQFDGLKGYRKENFLDCYSRLLIPEVAPELDKAIYLDTDTIALRDIKLFWDEDLENKSIGAVPDLGFRKSIQKRFVNKLGGNDKQIFLNGGLFVVDCKKWREQNITKKLLNLAKEKKDNIELIIEDLFSLFCTEDYKLLNSRYGFIETDNCADYIPSVKITKEYLDSEWKQVAIIHFAGSNKVWNRCINDFTHKTIGFFDTFWFFAKMTPFYDGMKLRFLDSISTKHKMSFAYCLKLFNKIPLFTIRFKNNRYTFRLFNLISLFSFEKKKKGN